MSKLLAKIFIKDYKNYQLPNVRSAYGILCGVVGIVSNLLLCISKILTGFLAGSISIIADGINNLSDAGSSIVTLIGFKISNTPADSEHPFGHQRIEYITGMIVSFVIIAVGIILMKSSIEKIISNEVATFSLTSVIILGVAIVVKLWQSIFYSKNGKLINSTALIATSIDSLTDCISTLVVLICSILALFNINVDSYAGILVSIFIIVNGIKLVKNTASPLLGEAPSKELINRIISKIKEYDGVLGIHDLVVHTYGPSKVFATVHVEVDSQVDILLSHDIIDNIEQDFLINDNINLVIHMDPVETNSEITNKLKEVIENILLEIDSKLTFHDFRVVTGLTHIKIIFDIVVPIKYTLSDSDLRKAIIERIKRYDSRLNPVITFDHNYLG